MHNENFGTQADVRLIEGVPLIWVRLILVSLNEGARYAIWVKSLGRKQEALASLKPRRTN